ncbi:MAG: hypothetical protein ACE5F1_22180 [Planctomycetota bacterium]
MRKACLSLALILACAFTSCYAGPHQLRRSVDDWDAKLYTENVWLDAALWVVPVIPLASLVAGLGDFLVTDAYTFWAKDAWDGKGTGFQHAEYLGSDGHMKSFLLDGSKWLQVDSGGGEQ